METIKKADEAKLNTLLKKVELLEGKVSTMSIILEDVLENTNKQDNILNSILNVVNNKIKSQKNIEFFRNKDLKEKFGLVENTIKKYRINGSIPFTKIGDIHLYPVRELILALGKNSNYKSK